MKCQCSFMVISCSSLIKKCTTLVGNVSNEEGYAGSGGWAKYICEISVGFPQFCYKTKTTLKKIV